MVQVGSAEAGARSCQETPKGATPGGSAGKKVASERRNGSNVTWSHLIAGLGVLFGLLSGMMTLIWNEHSKHPHVGAITESEMRQVEKRIDATIEANKEAIQRIEEKIDRVLQHMK